MDAMSDVQKVAAGQDRYGEERSMGISRIKFKLTPADSSGLFIIENSFHQAGGPARHLHRDQDEWFHVQQGEFVFEVGSRRLTLQAGDSLLGPRGVPHVWACTGAGSILIVFNPAGRMEAFFREVTKAGAMPPQDAGLWRAHEMELLGPPLTV